MTDLRTRPVPDAADSAPHATEVSTGSRMAGVVALALGAGAASVLTLVLVLLLGGGAPRAAPVGLPQTGPLVRWALEVLPLLSTVLGTLTVGFALLAGRFVGGNHVVRGVGTGTRLLAVAWACSGVLAIALTAVQVNTLAPGAALLEQLTGSVQLRATVAETVLAGAVALVVGRAPRLALPVAVVTLVPELLTGHVRTDASPLLAGVALIVHVVAASLWVGGLLALSWLAVRRRSAWLDALTGYSRIALTSVLALATSGTVVALERIHSWADLFGSAYGVVVVVKALVLVILAVAGMLQRRHVVARGAGGIRTFALLAAVELTLMGVAFALAAGLSQTPPPTPASDRATKPAAAAQPTIPLPAALVGRTDLPAGYTSGGHHHDPGPTPPANDPACAPIGELVGTHPSVLQTRHPQASVSFTKSHFGPLVTETIIDYRDPAAARDALSGFERSGSRCATYQQSTSSIGANRYRVQPGTPVDGAGGVVVRLTALGADFRGLTWDIWAARVGGRLVAVSLRSAPGGSNEDLAPAVEAARSRLAER